MKKVKVKNLRRTSFANINFKIAILTTFFLLAYALFPIFKFWNVNVLTDILWKKQISYTDLKQKVNKITFHGTTWPVKEITDLNYKNLSSAGFTYKEIREKNWKDIPTVLKTTFPTKWADYIKKYQNITLKNCWNTFSNSQKLWEFTFRRRILRATWTASYASDKIWKKNTWTHAGVDIIANRWTPVYNIADGLIVIASKNSKWFWNYVAILHKIKWQYFVSFYGHLNSIWKNIYPWKFVKMWYQIWTVWDSGNSFWTHLHFQVNKVSSLKEIVDGKLFSGWFHNLDGVKKYTVDPISFIEKTYTSKNDALVYMHKSGKLEERRSSDLVVEKTKVDIKKVVQKKTDLVLDKPVITKINNIKLSLVDNKLQVWNWFTLTLSVQPGHGAISILASNWNLSYSPDLITNPTKKTYLINFFALRAGNTKLKISDGNSIREYDIQVYTKDSVKIAWLNLEVQKLNLLKEVPVILYPTNKFGQKVNKKLIWNFKVYLEFNGIKKLIKKIYINDFDKKIYLKWYNLWKWKIIISSDKFYLKKNIVVDVAKDYPYTKKYAEELWDLVVNNIVKWDNGFMMPNKKLTRKELLIVLWRSILKTNYKKAKINMQNYLKTRWKFFKDIKWNSYSDPYIYDAWKKWIIKWENGFSLANNYVTRWELLTILTRTFKLPVKENSLNVWLDLKDKNLKAIADTVKQYNLYPFSNYRYFQAGNYVTREKAFVSLKRFIDLWTNFSLHASAKIDIKDKKDETLQSTMQNIFDF